MEKILSKVNALAIIGNVLLAAGVTSVVGIF